MELAGHQARLLLVQKGLNVLSRHWGSSFDFSVNVFDLSDTDLAYRVRRAPNRILKENDVGSLLT